MSSTTTNLGLVKMASGETIGQWSDANNGSGGNLDKIDTAVGNLNSQIANPKNVAYTNVTGTSQAQFEAALTTALDGIAIGEARVCPAYANYSQSLTNGGQGVAFIVKSQSTVWWCFLVYAGGVKAGYYTSNAWTWL